MQVLQRLSRSYHFRAMPYERRNQPFGKAQAERRFGSVHNRISNALEMVGLAVPSQPYHLKNGKQPTGHYLRQTTSF